MLKSTQVLSFTGKELRTCAIVPLTMYGELDKMFVYQYLQKFRELFIPNMPRLGKMESKVQFCYVGNMAMMFVRALEAMQRGDNIGGEYFTVQMTQLCKQFPNF